MITILQFKLTMTWRAIPYVDWQSKEIPYYDIPFMITTQKPNHGNARVLHGNKALPENKTFDLLREVYRGFLKLGKLFSDTRNYIFSLHFIYDEIRGYTRNK